MKKGRRLPKVVIDTNLFISGLILKRGFPRELYLSWRRGNFQLLISPYQKKEIARVLKRPVFSLKYDLAQSEIDSLFAAISSQAEVSRKRSPVAIAIRDPKDEAILSNAVAGRADYLVTGDQDFLAIASNRQLGKLKIVTARDFLRVLPYN